MTVGRVARTRMATLSLRDYRVVTKRPSEQTTMHIIINPCLAVEPTDKRCVFKTKAQLAKDKTETKKLLRI